jgi:hypothetical protein
MEFILPKSFIQNQYSKTALSEKTAEVVFFLLLPHAEKNPFVRLR